MTAFIRKAYDRLKFVPGGRWVFSRFVGLVAPYSGTICPSVRELGEGYAKIEICDRRHVRNHLRSVHAIAVMNLAELTSGLAFVYSLPANARAILTGLSIDYVKKARGTLTAECRCNVPSNNDRKEYALLVDVRDGSGDVVASAQAKWLVGPN